VKKIHQNAMVTVLTPYVASGVHWPTIPLKMRLILRYCCSSQYHYK